jgi:hypothetical protein
MRLTASWTIQRWLKLSFLLLFSFSLSIAQNAASGYADPSLRSCSRTLSPGFHAGCEENFTLFTLPSASPRRAPGMATKNDQ